MLVFFSIKIFEFLFIMSNVMKTFFLQEFRVSKTLR